MNSIKSRMLINFMSIIVITVAILEVFFISSLKQNYYKNLEDTLFNQLQISSDLYVKYFSDATLDENVLNNVDTFWKQVTAQVEIIDMDGKVLMDSMGIISENLSQVEDVKRALQGQRGKWIGKVPYDTEKVLAISYPLIVEEKPIGILRFIASLGEIDKEIQRIAWRFIVFGFLVVIISGGVSILAANTITRPLKEVTSVAEEMARGNYKAKSKVRSKDEIEKLSHTLNTMAEEIIKKEEIKNNFISSISHELRTPLTSIKGWAVTLGQGYVDKEMLKDGLDIIENESDRLTHMVEELLDFSKFVSGKVSLEYQEIYLPHLLDQLERQLTPRAIREEKKFDVTYGDINPRILMDGNRLKQVFINLLDNAFKFTEQGGKILLSSSYEKNAYIFTIEDNGCGIAQEEIPKVKEKFYKGRSSKAQNGIGLSLCDEIITMMGGTLKIESEIHEGTRVAITLPVEEVRN